MNLFRCAGMGTLARAQQMFKFGSVPVIGDLSGLELITQNICYGDISSGMSEPRSIFAYVALR